MTDKAENPAANPQTVGICPTCNGTGKEGRHSICRDCDEHVVGDRCLLLWDIRKDQNAYPEGPLAKDKAVYTFVGWEGCHRGSLLLTEAEAEFIRERVTTANPSAEPRPFAWYWHDATGALFITGDDRKPDVPAKAKPLYEHPPANPRSEDSK